MRAIQVSFRWLARAWIRFQRQRSGNVAITFALAVIPILAFVGAAIDYSRANALKVQLQDALNSTALMVSKNAASETSNALQTSAQTYFNALFTNAQAQNVQFTVSYSTSGGSSVVVNASAGMPTVFMNILGFKTLTVTGSSTAKWGSVRLRVALVLDNTGSMADNGKMTALQTATNNLLTQLQGAATTNGDVYVSIIPFAKDVNAGAGNYSSSWNSWIDWTPTAPSNSTPSASVGPGSACPYSNSSNGFVCVTKPAGTQTTSSVPSSGTYAGDICPSGNIGCYDSEPQTTTTSSPFCTGSFCSCTGRTNCSCTGSGSSKTCSQTTTTTTYVHVWFVDPTKWSGCFTDRGNSSGPVSDYDRLVTAPTSSIPATLFPAEQYNACPQPMMGLSYNWSGMTSLVNAMSPNGATNQPIGLVWGWQSLVGGGPFTAPAMDFELHLPAGDHPAVGRPQHAGSLVRQRQPDLHPGRQPDVQFKRQWHLRQYQRRRCHALHDPGEYRRRSDFDTAAELRELVGQVLPADVGQPDRHHLQHDRHQSDQVAHRAINKKPGQPGRAFPVSRTELLRDSHATRQSRLISPSP